jgi:hypothetical protein
MAERGPAGMPENTATSMFDRCHYCRRMSAKRGALLRVLALVFIMLAVLGVVAVRSQWSQAGKPAVPYGNAGKSLPVLEVLAREHVTFLRVQDWCQAYSDDRERRANVLKGSCTPGNDYELFDDASEKRFIELKSKLKDLPYDVRYIEMEYGPGGALRKAVMSIDTLYPFTRDGIVYDPGYVLPADRPGEFVSHRIDSDWYSTWEDWN